MTFAALLRQLKKDHYRTVRKFAEALDVDASHLSRAMQRGGLPFDVVRCLRLARLTGTHPSIVLRAAGKEDLADLIEQLYGPAAERRLSPEQEAILSAYGAIADPAVRVSLLELARAAAGLVSFAPGVDSSRQRA